MKPWLCGFSLAVSLGWLLPPGLADAWTEADMQGARRLLQGKLEQQRAAAAKAKAESEVKAAAKAKAEAEAQAARQRASDSIAQGMVKIPGGTFQMGCSPGDSQCFDSERQVHQVKLQSYRMGKYEVTQAQWQAVMKANPARSKGDDWPVENVSWNDIQDFLKRLNADRKGRPDRLPSEAEWEYAARAGSKTAYWWGQDLGQGNANCAECGSQLGGKETARVGSFKPNAFGLYDTVGNVWEWVQDCWHDSYAGAPSDGSAWGADSCTAGRVLRCGSWNSLAGGTRVSYRSGSTPGLRYAWFGLRLAQDL